MILNFWCISELFVELFKSRLARAPYTDAHRVGKAWALCCEQLLFLIYPTQTISSREITSFSPRKQCASHTLLEGGLVKVPLLPLLRHGPSKAVQTPPESKSWVEKTGTKIHWSQFLQQNSQSQLPVMPTQRPQSHRVCPLQGLALLLPFKSVSTVCLPNEFPACLMLAKVSFMCITK